MLTFPNKQIRAAVIADYVKSAGYKGVIAFSCGNATRALKAEGLRVLDIAPGGSLAPSDKWWKPEEIRYVFTDFFDATSGHLPLFLMERIADAFQRYLGALPEPEYEVPTGSGETILCLKLAYPSVRFIARYNLGEATLYNPAAPLNALIARMFPIRGLENDLKPSDPADGISLGSASGRTE